MAKNIEIVLLEDVKDVGRAGDTCRVRTGYARNYLLPKKLATVLTPGTARLIEKKKQEALARLAKEKDEAEKLLKVLGKKTVTCTVKANADGRLFGSVGAPEIIAALADMGFTVDKRQIHLDEPFKALGEHEVHLVLHPEVKGLLKLKIVAETVADAAAAE
ncbi:MAG: 50S ribosomal protein L9 [Kiritimatiellae bacterium]|nr:50S ribosomal protein L9 [Kiritimatiellia bacterium]